MADDKILQAVNQLDPNNDNHWTADGLPRLDTVKMLAGDPSITRDKLDAAAPGIKRNAPQAPAATAPATAATQPVVSPAPATPGSAPSEAPAPDTGVLGELGPAAPTGSAGPVPPVNALGEELTLPDPLNTAPAADELPTANEPTMVEGAVPEGMNVDDISGKQGPGGDRTPQIRLGVTEQGYNALNSPEDDLRDALATTAASPNKPTTLGGPKEPSELDGINADGLSIAADATGEAQLASLDGGRPGDPDAVTALEKELESAEARSQELRDEADKLTLQLNEAARDEARIRASIEAARPRTGTMEAVQGYFGAQDQRAEERLAAQRAIKESGVDLKALGRLTAAAPIDQR